MSIITLSIFLDYLGDEDGYSVKRTEKQDQMNIVSFG